MDEDNLGTEQHVANSEQVHVAQLVHPAARARVRMPVMHSICSVSRVVHLRRRVCL